MSMHHRVADRSHALGVGLVEILFVIALLGVFAVISTSIFRTSMNVLGRYQVDDASLRATDRAIEQMREDVWMAATLAGDPDRLTIAHADSTIEWSIREGFLERSTSVNDQQTTSRWPIQPLTVDWAVDEAGVLLDVRDLRRSTSTSTRLISQMMRLKGGDS